MIAGSNNQGLAGPLTLVIAPAGFGKTTLVASCVSSCSFPIGWLSVDKDDNDLRRFMSYLVASLQSADAGIGVGASELLLSSRDPASTEVLTSLINDIDARGSDLALVLDDYRFITSQSVHEAVSYLIQHCPPDRKSVV